MRRAIEQGRNVRMRPRQAHHRGPPTVGSLTCAPNGGINMIAHGPPVLRSGITPRLEIAGDESVSRRAAVPCGKYDLVKKLNGGLDAGGGRHGPRPSRRMARKKKGGKICKATYPTPPRPQKRRVGKEGVKHCKNRWYPH